MKHIYDRDTFFFPGSHLSAEGCALYADALVLEKVEMLPPGIREHVSACEVCRAEVYHVYAMVADNPEMQSRVRHPYFNAGEAGSVTGLPGSAPGRGGFTAGWKRYGMAASFLLLAGLSAALWFTFMRPDGDADLLREIAGQIEQGNAVFVPSAVESDTLVLAALPAGVDSLAGDQRLVPNPRLERMMEMRMRDNGFHLLSPGKLTHLRPGDRLRFEWRVDAPDNLVLMLMDNGGNSRLQMGLSGSGFTAVVGMPPGLYYWVIAKDKKMLSAGKFLVE